MIREKILSSAISKTITPITAIVLATALTGIGMMSIAQGQSNSTSSSSSSSLTPEQKDAICNPNNPASKLNPVNTTESRICGIPVTVKPHASNATSLAANTTTATQETSPPPPATSIAPSAVPPSQ